LHGIAFDHVIVHLIDALLFPSAYVGIALLEECLRLGVFTTPLLN
jgi:hypothetical protein